MTKTFTNTTEHAYKPTPGSTRVKLEVEVFLDMIPGSMHTIEDHIQLLFMNNPYAISAKVLSDTDTTDVVEVTQADADMANSLFDQGLISALDVVRTAEAIARERMARTEAGISENSDNEVTEPFDVLGTVDPAWANAGDASYSEADEAVFMGNAEERFWEEREERGEEGIDYELNSGLSDLDIDPEWATASVTEGPNGLEISNEAYPEDNIETLGDMLERALEQQDTEADGWLIHKVGECPVSADTKVEAQTRFGSRVTDVASAFIWRECGQGSIAKYRIIQ